MYTTPGTAQNYPLSDVQKHRVLYIYPKTDVQKCNSTQVVLQDQSVCTHAVGMCKGLHDLCK